MDVLPRASGDSGSDQFLRLIADPFQSQVQQSSIYAAIVYSFALSGVLVIVFCLLRPRNSNIYAPRAKHAEAKHRPQQLDKKPFSWLAAVRDVKEQDLVDAIGLDAVVFLRFMRMIRNIFLVLSVLGCGILIPINVVGGSSFFSQWNNISTLMKFTPQYIFGAKFWAFVLVAYLLQATVCFFVWWNYKAVLKLRRAYFNTQEYKSSLHSRTLLLTHIPKASRTDAGLVDLIEQTKNINATPRAAIGRNVKDLPKMIQDHDDAVRELEQHLAKYMRNPNHLPRKRPTCRAKKDDIAVHGKDKLDAIDYLADRIARLETRIKEVRESVDMRNPMPYGFASYTHIEDAHAVAHASKKQGPAGCDVYLAPKPHDLLWQNLPMSRKTRRIRAFWDGFWVVLFTLAFVVPNLLTSVFLSDFSHLGLVWPAFQTNLEAHPTSWAIAQGIVAPLVQTLMYMGVPVVFRRLFTHSGDVSKTSRERHVTARLYAFFVFNNLLVFSVFGSAWRFVAAVIAAKDQGVWEAIRDNHLFAKVMTGLCNVSTFWLSWQMMRNLGAAIDLSQAWMFLWSWIRRTFFSPTPRELIELSAPPPFPYAEYYNNYLFVSTVGMCIGALQPIILPVTAFYLAADCIFKTYLLQYVFITKTESGGRFWRLLVNRLLFAVLFANAVIALVVGAQGVGSINSVQNGNMLYTMVPLPILMFAFKWYCKRSFDDKLEYYTTIPYSDMEGGSESETKERRSNRVGVRYGNPALYQKLLTPMVHAKSQHLLKDIFAHHGAKPHDIFASSPHEQSTTDRARPATLGYSDTYMDDDDLSHSHPHPASDHLPHVEFIAESDLDFENFKKRAEFRDQFGGNGQLYGRPDDLTASSSRPGTPSTFSPAFNDTSSPNARNRGARSPAHSRASSRTGLGGGEELELEQGTAYKRGYHRADNGLEEIDVVDSRSIPGPPVLGGGGGVEGVYLQQGASSNSSKQRLVGDVGGVGGEDTSYEPYRRGV